MKTQVCLRSHATARTLASALLGTLALCACGNSAPMQASDSGAQDHDAKGSHEGGAEPSGTFSFTTIDGSSGAPTTIDGMNNQGTLVGFTTVTTDGGSSDGGSTNTNFLRSASGTLSMLDLGDPAGMANGVNKSDEVVGVANGEAFILVGTKMESLMPFGATSSVAFGVNDEGVVVGQYTEGSLMPGFVDAGGTFTKVSPTAKSLITNLQGINNHGLAIGFYSEEADGLPQHGFSFDTTSMQTMLIGDPSTARITSGGLVLTQFLAINDSDLTVGYYQTKDGSQYGFLYDLTTKVYTYVDHPQAVPYNGVQITQITGVDDAGQIAGFYVDGQGNQHGFMASPSRS
jgi:hypothetical protein